MSGYNYESDSEYDRSDNTGSGLRDQLEKAIGKIDDLQTRLNNAEREKTVTGLLKDKGLDPAVAELIPEGADPAQWLDEKGHLLGVKKERQNFEESTPEPTDPEVPDDGDPALANEREARAAQEAARGGGEPLGSQDVLDRMGKIDSEDELIKFFERNGAEG